MPIADRSRASPGLKDRKLNNRLLKQMGKADLTRLEPHLKATTFSQHSVLFEADQTIKQVYFPTGAVVSLVVSLSTGEMIEVAMVGTDGVVGASAALDGRMSLSRGIVQLAGEIIVCDIDALKTVALQSPQLLSLLIRHEHTVYAQAQQSVACFAVHQVEARLCRWLLRARDLSDGDTLKFTQENLSELLGVRRTSVSSVARTLQEAGLIKYSRGRIQILNAARLQENACECYGVVKLRYDRLLGRSTH
jgi:CRP-like cAMP-binding protein